MQRHIAAWRGEPNPSCTEFSNRKAPNNWLVSNNWWPEKRMKFSSIHSRIKSTHSHIFLLPEKAHPDVIPQWGALRSLCGCYAVLRERHVEIPMMLHHAPSSKNGFHVARIVGKGIAQMFKRLLELTSLKKKKIKIRNSNQEWPYVTCIYSKPKVVKTSPFSGENLQWIQK